ncbi:hypothetical protein QBC40DRAFT_35768 [Triangularia verruculosa]|uniref:TMEM205-like domain-containing protein n=1 Tax=Triangularia verruculosa TaxID=2587418 RepID=A0AAN6XVP3_9PEZI|nr:hypothetical protein QBC40DRAFT_35768 [Triangularia verruculosa]
MDSPTFTALAALPPIHLLCFSSLLGATLYQSFVITKISYRALPMSAFRSLQKQVWPFYFRAQAAFIFATAITIPGDGSLFRSAGTLTCLPHAVALTSALLNTFIFESATRKAMIEVAHQETRDARSQITKDADLNKEQGDETSTTSKQIKKRFSSKHAMCIHLNLVTMGAILAYGWTLASRLN